VKRRAGHRASTPLLRHLTNWRNSACWP